jgi:hypothetical protein
VSCLQTPVEIWPTPGAVIQEWPTLTPTPWGWSYTFILERSKSASIEAEGKYNGWYIFYSSYSDNGAQSSFVIVVDTSGGGYQIIHE